MSGEMSSGPRYRLDRFGGDVDSYASYVAGRPSLEDDRVPEFDPEDFEDMVKNRIHDQAQRSAAAIGDRNLSELGVGTTVPHGLERHGTGEVTGRALTDQEQTSVRRLGTEALEGWAGTDITDLPDIDLATPYPPPYTDYVSA